jgi:hypothetical protein
MVTSLARYEQPALKYPRLKYKRFYQISLFIKFFPFLMLFVGNVFALLFDFSVGMVCCKWAMPAV